MTVQLKETEKSGTRFQVVDVPLQDSRIAKGLVDLLSPQQNPIVVDFNGGNLIHRLRKGSNNEAVVKAMGVKQSLRSQKVILDFTAGLGTDSYILARAGFSVIAIERNPLLFTLLKDGLERYTLNNSESLFLQFVFGDSIDHESFLKFEDRPYAIYLDPMFEGAATVAKSRPKKQMASLRELLGSASIQDTELLFQKAIHKATDRVVVKRPIGSPTIVSVKDFRPIRQLAGKSARFDVYSCR